VPASLRSVSIRIDELTIVIRPGIVAPGSAAEVEAPAVAGRLADPGDEAGAAGADGVKTMSLPSRTHCPS
jgi:hypothetical protein